MTCLEMGLVLPGSSHVPSRVKKGIHLPHIKYHNFLNIFVSIKTERIFVKLLTVFILILSNSKKFVTKLLGLCMLFKFVYEVKSSISVPSSGSKIFPKQTNKKISYLP